MIKLGLILLLFNVYYVNSLYEGDHCTDDTSSSGVCQLIDNCASARDNIQNGVFPKICGFQGNQVIVCCIIAPAPVKKPERTPGEKATEMCEKYAQYVWVRKPSPLLLIGADDIVTRECPFDRLQLIVGGSPASRREFPHMVQLGFGENPVNWACGGSLISDQYVLTAAHCLDDKSLGPVLYARMGFTDIDDKEHLQEYDIIERIPYPNYSEPAHYHDIALVKLKEKAFLNTYVRPACLYTSSQSPWSNVIAIGWGRIEFGGSDSSVLLRVILELFSQSKCNKVYRADSKTAKLKDGIRDDVMICAGHSEELKDTCQGDSGGPLQVYRTGGGENMTCMYDIIGVTSFGKGCALAVDIPGVYTRVSYYVKWIEDIVWPV